jgi:hypothetical protein
VLGVTAKESAAWIADRGTARQENDWMTSSIVNSGFGLKLASFIAGLMR